MIRLIVDELNIDKASRIIVSWWIRWQFSVVDIVIEIVLLSWISLPQYVTSLLPY